MNNNRVSLKDEKSLYVRIPGNLDSMSIVELTIPKSFAGKTLKIKLLESDDSSIPFESDAIEAETDNSVLCYCGSDSYWEPENYSRTVVEGNTDCDYSECNYDCHVVSCAVHQGYASDAPLVIAYVRSNKLKKRP